MSGTAILPHRETEHLVIEVAANGRRAATIQIWRRGTDETLLVDEAVLTKATGREALLGKVAPEFHEQLKPILLEFAAELYERQLDEPAKAQTGTSPFPEFAPWDQPVLGPDVLSETQSLLTRYMVFPSHASEALALWVAHTYVTDVTDYTPYIAVTSPVRECGKSTLLELLYSLTYRPRLTGGITAAALYRQVERHTPTTMLLDELDARLRGDSAEALRAVLNTGFQRSGKVTICVGDQHEDKDFRTFCPKVLAGIGRLWDTVTSRSIPIRLARASREQLAVLSKIRGDRIDGICLPYRRRLLRWTRDVRDRLLVTDSVTPVTLGARQCDVWRPLLAIADVAGGHWPETARQSALALHGVAEEEGDYGLLLLEDLRAMFGRHQTDALFTATILEELAKREDRPWPEYSRDKAITARGVARLVGRFDVKPKTVRVGNETQKGYDLEALAPVFKRYLSSPELSVTSVTEPSVTDVTDRNSTRGDAWEPESAAA